MSQKWRLCNPLLRTIWGQPRNEAENQLDNVDNVNKLISLTERLKGTHHPQQKQTLLYRRERERSNRTKHSS